MPGGYGLAIEESRQHMKKSFDGIIIFNDHPFSSLDLSKLPDFGLIVDEKLHSHVPNVCTVPRHEKASI